MVFFRFSKSYFLLKPFVVLAHKLYYRRIKIYGKENIPEHGPVIFAPNHQNALMDPLAIICSNKRQITFLARADIFQKKIINWILTRLKIIPIYRIRDGKESLKKNEEVFALCADILKHQRALALFPEGSHNDHRGLMALRKAIPRIAFRAESESDFNLGLSVVPVGINYSHYTNFRTELLIEYGEPILISQYEDLFRESEEKAYRTFTQELRKGILPLMVHIEDTRNHVFYENACKIKARELAEHRGVQHLGGRGRRILDQEIVDRLHSKLKNDSQKQQQLNDQLSTYFTGLKELKIRNWILEKDQIAWLWGLKALAILFLLPIHLYGSINNFIVYQFLRGFVNRKIKDEQFHSTFKFGVGLVLIPVIYGVQSFFVYLVSNEVYWTLLYVLSLPLSGMFAFSYMIYSRKLAGVFRFFHLKRNNNQRLIESISLRENILDEINAIIGR